MTKRQKMSILKWFQKGEQSSGPDMWSALDNTTTWQRVKEASVGRDQWVFKHSPSCGISLSVKRRLEERLVHWPHPADHYLMDVIQHRQWSRSWAEEVAVIHQSPQLLIFRSGKVIWHASHYDILDIQPDTLASI